jgi:hypothetical protein
LCEGNSGRFAFLPAMWERRRMARRDAAGDSSTAAPSADESGDDVDIAAAHAKRVHHHGGTEIEQ